VQICVWGFWANGLNITIYLFIYTPFLGTHLQVKLVSRFLLDGSNNADSCKHVPFGDFVYIPLHLVGEISASR